MKTLVKALALFFAMGLFCSIPQKTKAQATVSFQVFYDGLSPYGQWIDSPNYGYVWVPDAGVGFVPYGSAGHWAYTNYGWTWVSDYDWGWAPFHYGRWVYDNFYGWMWIPGDEWAPAWVSWRVCDGFYGWAPLAPNVSIGLWFGFGVPASSWVFVRDRYFTDPHVYSYYEPRRNNDVFIRRSTVINTTGSLGRASYYTGPERSGVERSLGHPVSLYTVNDRTKPGQSLGKNDISIYRPAVSARVSGRAKPAPARAIAYRQSTPKEPEVNNRIAPANRQEQHPQNRTMPQSRSAEVQQRSNTRYVSHPVEPVYSQRANVQQRQPVYHQERMQQPMRSSPAISHPQPSRQGGEIRRGGR